MDLQTPFLGNSPGNRKSLQSHHCEGHIQMLFAVPNCLSSRGLARSSVNCTPCCVKQLFHLCGNMLLLLINSLVCTVLLLNLSAWRTQLLRCSQSTDVKGDSSTVRANYFSVRSNLWKEFSLFSSCNSVVRTSWNLHKGFPWYFCNIFPPS